MSTPSAKPAPTDQPGSAEVPQRSDEQLQTSEATNNPLPSSRRAVALSDQIKSESDSRTIAPSPSAAVPADDAIALHQSWQQILAAIRPRSRSVEALLRDCTPLSFDGTIILLQFWYAFHKKQLETDKNHRLVEEVASQVFGAPVKVKCQLGDKSQRPKKRPMTEADVHNVAAVVEEGSLAQAAAEIFGGEFID